jgi:hypothetical protein
MSGTMVSTARPDLAAELAEFERNGFVIIRGALTPDEGIRSAGWAEKLSGVQRQLLGALGDPAAHALTLPRSA